MPAGPRIPCPTPHKASRRARRRRLLATLIHPSAWKGYSPKFAPRGFSEIRAQGVLRSGLPVAERLAGSPEEPALHEGVDASPQRLEEGRHQQRGGEVGDPGVLHV